MVAVLIGDELVAVKAFSIIENTDRYQDFSFDFL